MRNGGFVLATGKTVSVIDKKGNLVNMLQEKSVSDVVFFTRGCYEESNSCDTEKVVYYLVSEDEVIKRLDARLNVMEMRKIEIPARFEWVRDRKTREMQMMFGPTKQFPSGYRLSFDSRNVIPVGWCFEMKVASKDRQIYSIGQTVVAYDECKNTPAYEYVNYSGIWIFDCSFKDIKGELSEADGQLILKKNGGIVNGASC